MFRPTIADMQDKYYGDGYDIYHIPNKYTKVAASGRHHKRGDAAAPPLVWFPLYFVAITSILVMHGGNGRSEHV